MSKITIVALICCIVFLNSCNYLKEKERENKLKRMESSIIDYEIEYLIARKLKKHLDDYKTLGYSDSIVSHEIVKILKEIENAEYDLFVPIKADSISYEIII